MTEQAPADADRTGWAGRTPVTYLKIVAHGVEGQLTLFLRKRTIEYATFSNSTRVAFVRPKWALITDPGSDLEPDAPRTAFGRLFPRDGPHGRFLSGYTGPLMDTGRRFGRRGQAILEIAAALDEDEDGARNSTPVVANIYGPESDVILSMLHVRPKPKAPSP
jgi:hypothetical protein